MRVVFLGVGDAFDENALNVSMVVESRTRRTRILLDCGFTVPVQLWKYDCDPNCLDAIYISHFHADHTFGIPPLITRMGEDGRTKPLAIIGQVGTRRYICDLMEYGFPSILERLGYVLEFKEVSTHLPFGEFELAFANARHSICCLAVRMRERDRTISYSGDGEPTPSTVTLYHESDLLIHEAYSEEERVPGHATVAQVFAAAKSARVRKLGLVHMRRAFRMARAKPNAKGFELVIPSVLDEIAL